MRRLLSIAALPLALFFVGFASAPAHAATFNAGKIIDDSVFTNNSSMSVAQIQAFLNSKVPTCDTNGSMPASDFGRPDLTHAQYAASRGWQAPPYTCLRNYVEGGKTSAQIIFDISQQYRINPQVFIVLLQKETGLVTDTWPLAWQYRTAGGYGCPDSTPGVCDTSYYGFTNQMSWAAKLFRSVLDQSPTWYSPYVVGNNYIQWNPATSCGGSNVYIQNWSTAALYDYTPYQPNQSALNAGYGMGDSCGAYGNRNFWLYFNDWFGATIAADYDYSFVGSSASFINLDYGQSKTANSISIKNMGANNWYADGAAPVGKTATRLSVLAYGETPFADTSDPNWLGTKNQVKMTPATVKPGEVATFTFSLKAPNNSVSQTITFVPVVDGVGFMRNSNMQFAVQSVGPTYSYVSSSFAPSQLYPDQKFTANLVIKNNGNGPWYADGAVPLGKSAFRLSTRYYGSNPFADTSDPNWLGTTNQVKMSPALVNPGENATFTFNLTGTAAKTDYTYNFLPVLDGVAFLKDYGMAFQLHSPGRTYDYSFESATGPPAVMSPGSSVTTTLQIRNTGGATWKNESTRTANQTSLRLVMAKPWYRAGLFYDSSDPNWLTSSQIAMITPQVAPGEVGTFTFKWKAPLTPGVYTEYFAPVADGVTLMHDINMGFKVTVQ